MRGGLVHLSDLHHQLDWRSRSFWHTGWRGVPGRVELHGFGRLHRFQHATDRIRRLVDATLEREAGHVVITGDFTALGHPHELEHARELLSPLAQGGRLSVIPGNHDRYVGPRHEFERHFASLMKSELPQYADERGYPFVKLLDEKFALVGLDSTRVSGWTHYFFGRIGADQLTRLGLLLDDPAFGARTALIMIHHGPVAPTGRYLHESGLLDADALLRALHGRRAVVLHGHAHRRSWIKAEGGRPHLLGAGSSTEHGATLTHLRLDDHLALEPEPHVLP
jgi:3',5'-cyclic AMP phosphodiesterase CpdA